VVARLRERYAAIGDDATNLESQLREVERATVNPAARRVMKLTIQALVGVKESAGKMVTFFDVIDPDQE
jgi:hypothetical protein